MDTNKLILITSIIILIGIGVEIFYFPAEYIKLQQSAILLRQDAINAEIVKNNIYLENVKYELKYYKYLMLTEYGKPIVEINNN